jgi:hypothetical protein
MSWQDKIAAGLGAMKEIMVGTLGRFGVTPQEAVTAVDDLSKAIEAPLAVWLTSRGLPPALAQGAAHAALSYVDAAAAGLLAGKGK